MSAARVAIGGVFHESNTFARGLTTLADFRAQRFHAGDDLLELRETRSDVGGFLQAAATRGWDAVPTLYAAATPSGVVEREAYVRLGDELCERLQSARPDAVLLALHGALVAEDDAEGDAALVERVRAAVGDVPVVASVDFHANVSDRLIAALDGMSAYRTYPHVDMFESGGRAAALLDEMLHRDERAGMSHRKVGLLTAPQTQYTDSEPMRRVMRTAAKLEREHGVLIAVTPGFPYADVPHAGFSVCASSFAPRAAERVLDDVESFVLARAEEFIFDPVPVGDAIARASTAEQRPVALVDSADNVGGGAPGDGTAIVEAWLAAGLSGLLAFVADPEAVGIAVAAGAGASVRLSIGGKTDALHGAPLEVEGVVVALADGGFTYAGSYNTGCQATMGQTAVLEVAGNTIVLTTQKVPPFDIAPFTAAGVRPAEYRAIVVKSAVAWRAALGEIVAAVIEVDTPGICTGRLSRLQLTDRGDRRSR